MNKLHDDDKLTGKRKSQASEQSQLLPFSQPNRTPECERHPTQRWQRRSASNELVNHCCFIALKLIVILWRYAFNIYQIVQQGQMDTYLQSL